MGDGNAFVEFCSMGRHNLTNWRTDLVAQHLKCCYGYSKILIPPPWNTIFTRRPLLKCNWASFGLLVLGNLTTHAVNSTPLHSKSPSTQKSSPIVLFCIGIIQTSFSQTYSWRHTNSTHFLCLGSISGCGVSTNNIMS